MNAQKLYMFHSDLAQHLTQSLSSIENLQKSLHEMENRLLGIQDHGSPSQQDKLRAKSIKLVHQAKQALKNTKKKVDEIKGCFESSISKHEKKNALELPDDTMSLDYSGNSPTERSRRRKRICTEAEKFEDNKQRGDYVTVSAQTREKVFKILHEQAQIWYDIRYNPYIDPKTRKQRQELLISPDMPLKIQENKVFDCLNISSEPDNSSNNQNDNLIPADHYEDYRYPPEQFEYHLAKQGLVYEDNIDLDARHFGDKSPFKGMSDYNNFSNYEEYYHQDKAKNTDLMIYSPGNTPSKLFLSDSKENLLQDREENDFRSEFNSRRNQVTKIPIEPLGKKIPITLPEKDIMAYLKDNEDVVNEENKRLDPAQQQQPIIKTISRITGIHEKTLKRIATGGPLRKIGGGRKRMDSDMEKDLTRYIVELNKRGRPPIRGEVKILGQMLSNVPGFAASKGWLDKFFSRVTQEIAQGDQELKEYFKIISYADVKKIEAERKIVTCLIEMGAPEHIVERFRNVRTCDHEETLEGSIEGSLKGDENGEGVFSHASIYLGDDTLEFQKDQSCYEK